MDHSWIDKILIGLVILGVVVLTLLRVGMGTAAAAGLGHFPSSMIPPRLRRLLFGERNDARQKHN